MIVNYDSDSQSQWQSWYQIILIDRLLGVGICISWFYEYGCGLLDPRARIDGACRSNDFNVTEALMSWFPFRGPDWRISSGLCRRSSPWLAAQVSWHFLAFLGLTKDAIPSFEAGWRQVVSCEDLDPQVPRLHLLGFFQLKVWPRPYSQVFFFTVVPCSFHFPCVASSIVSFIMYLNLLSVVKQLSLITSQCLASGTVVFIYYQYVNGASGAFVSIYH